MNVGVIRMLEDIIQEEVESGVESNRIPRRIRSRGDDVSIGCTWDFAFQLDILVKGSQVVF